MARIFQQAPLHHGCRGLLEVVLLGVERVVLLKKLVVHPFELEQHGAFQKARGKPLPLLEEKNTEIEALLRREITELAARALALTQPRR